MKEKLAAVLVRKFPVLGAEDRDHVSTLLCYVALLNELNVK